MCSVDSIYYEIPEVQTAGQQLEESLQLDYLPSLKCGMIPHRPRTGFHRNEIEIEYLFKKICCTVKNKSYTSAQEFLGQVYGLCHIDSLYSHLISLKQAASRSAAILEKSH